MLRRHRLTAYASGGFGLSINAIGYLLVPLLAFELGAGVAVIGLLVAAKALVETVLSVPLGAFIDRAGPRRAVLIGTAGTAVVGAGLMVTPSVAVLFALQIALGAVRLLGWLGGQSYVAGMRGTSMRAHDTGRFGFAANLGQIVAPLTAGAVAGALGTRAGFGVVAGFGLAFFLLGWLLPDTARHPGAAAGGSGFGAAGALLRLSGVRVVMLLSFCRLWIPAVWSSFFPLYLVREGGTPAVAGSVIAVMASSATVASLFTGRIARLGSAVQVTAAGLALSCVGIALSPSLGAVPWAYLAAVLVGFGQGLSLPMLITLTSEAVPAEVRSLALGLRSTVNQAAATLAPATIGPLIAVVGVVVGFPVAAAVGGGVLVVAVVLGRARGGATG